MQEKILVVRFGSLGDVILTSPAVLNCKIRFPDSRLTYLTKARYRDVVARFDGVDEIITLPDDAGPVAFSRLLRDIEQSGFTHLIDLHANLRSWWARTLLAVPRTVVYDKRRLQRRNIVRTGYHPHSSAHTIDLYNRALKQFGIAPYAQRPILYPPDNGLDGVADFSGHEPLVAIAPGAAHPPKRWPAERFIETAQLIREKTGARVFWLVTQAEQATFAQLDGTGDPPAHVLIDYPIPALARLLSRCRVTLTNDSGMAHLSSAVGTPTLALFGPTHPALGFA
ncbi:MAG: glycosyltransferase family 9 protein, partial [Candidatus Zixiibacteriota bacterium]